jgi:hypothetical protein
MMTNYTVSVGQCIRYECGEAHRDKRIGRDERKLRTAGSRVGLRVPKLDANIRDSDHRVQPAVVTASFGR